MFNCLEPTARSRVSHVNTFRDRYTKPNALRPGIVGMRGSCGHTTAAMNENELIPGDVLYSHASCASYSNLQRVLRLPYIEDHIFALRPSEQNKRSWEV